MNASSVLALTEFSVAAHAEQINRTARALERNGFTVEVLDDAQAAVRPQVQALDRATWVAGSAS